MHLYYLAVNLDRVKLSIFAHIAYNATQVSKLGRYLLSDYNLVIVYIFPQCTSVQYRPDKKLACTIAMTTFVGEDQAVLQPVETTKIM